MTMQLCLPPGIGFACPRAYAHPSLETPALDDQAILLIVFEVFKVIPVWKEPTVRQHGKWMVETNYQAILLIVFEVFKVIPVWKEPTVRQHGKWMVETNYQAILLIVFEVFKVIPVWKEPTVRQHGKWMVEINYQQNGNWINGLHVKVKIQILYVGYAGSLF